MSSSSTLLDSLAAIGVIPVVTVEDSAHAAPMVQALAEGGLSAAEITFRTPAAAEAIAEAAAAHPEALIGAGTVITEKQVDAAAEAGAKYVVSPGTSARVIERAQHHGLAVLPGAVTATEIQAAMEHGIRTVKFFPAEASGGAAALRALAGPFGDVTFVPTGGVNLQNLEEYLSLKQVRAVGGTWITPQEALSGGDFDRIRRLSAEASAAVSHIRG